MSKISKSALLNLFYFSFLIGSVSCSSLGEKVVIGEELHPEFLKRLKKSHGNNKYFYISSNKSCLKFDGRISLRSAIDIYVRDEVKNMHVCNDDPVLDETASWTSDRDVIYVNFFCK